MAGASGGKRERRTPGVAGDAPPPHDGVVGGRGPWPLGVAGVAGTAEGGRPSGGSSLDAAQRDDSDQSYGDLQDDAKAQPIIPRFMTYLRW